MALVPLATLAACLAEPPPAPPGADQPDADAGPAGDAGGDAAPPRDAPIADQLLDNENFERGTEGWTIDGNAMIGDADALGVTMSAASGEFFAQVGRKDSVVNGISQAVAIPPWAGSLVLTGQRCFTTDEDDSTRDDVLWIRLLDADGTTLETLFTTSNAEVDVVCSWTELSLVPAESHAGETIQIQLEASADSEDVTAFWFDDLRLVASPD